MKNLSFLLLTFLAINFINAQAPSIDWQNTIGGNDTDVVQKVEQTSDGGYIIAGISNSDISGDKTENSIGSNDYWVVKLNTSGEIEWQNTIGGNNSDALRSINQTIDGGYILGGTSDSDISGDKTENSYGQQDYWVVKLNSLGVIEWDKTFGGLFQDFLYSISQTSDGEYILGGFSSSPISGNKTEDTNGLNDYWIIKIDSSGNILWQNSIGGSNQDRLFSIVQTTDAGYFIGGYSISDISGDKTENSNGGFDYWVVKLNLLGEIEWQNTIGGDSSDFLTTIEQTIDGGYILAGESDSNISGDKTENNNGSTDYWIVKLNSLGEIEWQNTIGGDSIEDLDFGTIFQTNDGGYFLSGMSLSDISGDKTENSRGGFDYWVLKLDETGIIVWQKTIGGSEDDFWPISFQTNDGGFVISGSSLSDISGDKTENSNGGWDYWIVKLDPEELSVQENSISPLVLSPNPVDNILDIEYSSNIEKVIIYTISGAKVLEIENLKILAVDLSQLTSGSYIIKLISAEKTFIKKFIKK